MEMNDDMKL